MTKSKISGPVVTLVAVAALGAGIWAFNVSQESKPAPPAKTVAAATTTQAPAAAPSSSIPPPPSFPAFPAKANYVGKIPTANGHITLEITINGDKAVAYACDGNTVEVWLRGSATNGVLALKSKDSASTLDGHLDGDGVVGTLKIGQESFDYTTKPVAPPAGLYVYNANGVRTSWILQSDGSLTGVERRADGSTGPAGPKPDAADKVEGDEDGN
jgi:hypothetical protein